MGMGFLFVRLRKLLGLKILNNNKSGEKGEKVALISPSYFYIAFSLKEMSCCTNNRVQKRI